MEHLHLSTAAPAPGGRGFTLVELLVVIGIIAVLIAMLLPALSKAQRAAQNVQCQSNMRQWYMALISYTQENDGWVPAPNNQYVYGETKYRWDSVFMLGKYVPGKMNAARTSFTVWPLACPSNVVVLSGAEYVNYPTYGVSSVYWAFVPNPANPAQNLGRPKYKISRVSQHLLWLADSRNNYVVNSYDTLNNASASMAFLHSGYANTVSLGGAVESFSTCPPQIPYWQP